MSPHLPHGVAAWTIAAYYLIALPIALAVHWWRNRPTPTQRAASAADAWWEAHKEHDDPEPWERGPAKPAHPPTGALPLVEGRRVSTFHPGGIVKSVKEPPYDFFYRLPPRAGVRAMFDPGKGTRP